MIDSLIEFKEKIERLKDWHLADGELPPSEELLKGVLCVSRQAATAHRAYHHYTSIDSFEKIFGGRAPRLRLTRLLSARLNDQNECDKYAPREMARQTFIACFNHDGAECANLWYLYAHGNPWSLRISFPQEQFKDWCTKIRTENQDIVDVIYAAVKGSKDDYPFDRQNTLAWEDKRISVADLATFIRAPQLAGRLKDYEWRNEHETRIIISKASAVRFQYVELPPDLVASMRITTSPWVTGDEYEIIRNRVSKCLKEKWKLSQKNFRPSVLERSMDVLRK